jgi:hypothetical protein
MKKELLDSLGLAERMYIHQLEDNFEHVQLLRDLLDNMKNLHKQALKIPGYEVSIPAAAQTASAVAHLTVAAAELLDRVDKTFEEMRTDRALKFPPDVMAELAIAAMKSAVRGPMSMESEKEEERSGAEQTELEI